MKFYFVDIFFVNKVRIMKISLTLQDSKKCFQLKTYFNFLLKTYVSYFFLSYFFKI